jgi:hypothetical protein
VPPPFLPRSPGDSNKTDTVRRRACCEVMCDTVQRQRRVAANMTVTRPNDASCTIEAGVGSASPAAIDIVGGATFDAGGRVVDLVAVFSILSLLHWSVFESRHDLLVGSPLVAHRL